MQFHPLAYIVKLNIEMSMANLIAKVSRYNPADATSINDIIMHPNGRRYIDQDSADLPTRRSDLFAEAYQRDKQRREAAREPHKDFNISLSDADTKSQDLELMEVGRVISSLDDSGIVVHLKKEVHVSVSRASADCGEGRAEDADSGKGDSDERPLRERLEADSVDKHGKRFGPGYGSKTHIWGHPAKN